MPQMSPIKWFSLFIMLNLMYMLFYMLNFFFINFIKINKNLHKKKNNYLNWKW